MRKLALFLSGIALLLPACTSSSTTPTNTPAPPASTPPASSGPSGALLASGQPLPEGCAGSEPSADQTAAFVAGGRAWALDTAGNLTCLFDVSDPGPFIWGPLGDRSLLANLQIASTPGGPDRAPSDVTPGAAAAWGHPMGLAVVFASADGSRLEKLRLGQHAIDDITPVKDASYLNVVYHPSGLALAFVLEKAGRQSIWFSSNEGADPKRLVFTRTGTRFTDIAFSSDGRFLTYVAEHAQGYPQLHSIDLTQPDQLANGWRGPVGQNVQDLQLAPRGGRAAVTFGTSCSEAQAAFLEGRSGSRPALPLETRPTRAVGWLGPGTLLVGAGGCDVPLDLSAVDLQTGAVTPLVSGVDAAATRAPAPKAPTTLPKGIETPGGSGLG